MHQPHLYDSILNFLKAKPSNWIKFVVVDTEQTCNVAWQFELALMAANRKLFLGYCELSFCLGSRNPKAFNKNFGTLIGEVRTSETKLKALADYVFDKAVLEIKGDKQVGITLAGVMVSFVYFEWLIACVLARRLWQIDR